MDKSIRSHRDSAVHFDFADHIIKLITKVLDHLTCYYRLHPSNLSRPTHGTRKRAWWHLANSRMCSCSVSILFLHKQLRHSLLGGIRIHVAGSCWWWLSRKSLLRSDQMWVLKARSAVLSNSCTFHVVKNNYNYYAVIGNGWTFFAYLKSTLLTSSSAHVGILQSVTRFTSAFCVAGGGASLNN